MKTIVDILVFSYNNEDVIEECLDGIKNQTLRAFACTLVDDGSSDTTVSIVRKKYPWVKVIEKTKNTGPSLSRNIGIEKTEAEFMVMMDSDVKLEKTWLAEQVRMIKSDEPIAVVGSKLLYATNPEKINSAGGCLTRLGFGFDRGRGRESGFYNKIEKIIYACSAAWIMRRSVTEQVGLFDETFFYPHEDTDFCWRANISGFRVVYNPAAIAYHYVGESTKNMSNRVAFHATKNRIRSILKNYEARNIIKYLPLHLFLVFLDIIFRRNKIAKIGGVLWNVTNAKNTLKERRKVQKMRTLTDNELKPLFVEKII